MLPLRYAKFFMCTIQHEAPKWMKFFKNSSGLQINMLRSLKNEATEQLNLHIKQNYRSFTNEELIVAFLKRDLTFDAFKLIHSEVIDRLLEKQLYLTDELMIYLFSRDISYLNFTNLFGCSILDQTCLKFDQLELSQQFEFSKHSFRYGYIHPKIFKQFLNNLREELLDNLNLINFKSLIRILSQSKNLDCLQPTFLETLLRKYINKLNNFEQVSEDLYKYDFGSIMLNKRPYFWNVEQFQEIKQSYAKILEKLVDRNYGFIIQKPIQNTKEILIRILNLYEPNDYKLLQNSLSHLLLIQQKVDSQKMDNLICPVSKYFQLFQAQIYFQQMKNTIRQQGGKDLQKIDIRGIHSLLQSNALEALQQVLKESTEPSEAKATITKMLIDYLDSVRDGDLTEIINEVFNISSEGNIEFNDQEYSELLNFIKLKEGQSTIDQMVRVEQEYQDLHQKLINKGFERLYIIKNDKRIHTLDPVFNFIESLFYLSTLQPTCLIYTKLFQTQHFLKLLRNLTYLPQFLENMVQIYNTWPQLFSDENKNYIQEIKKVIDNVYNSSKDPQDFVDKIEDMIPQDENIDISKYFDKMFQVNLHFFNFVRQPPHIEINKDIQNPYEEFTLTETYSNNNRNMALRLSCRSDIIIQHTHFKELIKQALQQDTEEWLMNYSDFPYLVDFICLKQKIVVLIDEYPRLIKGVEKIRTYNTILTQYHFEKKGFQVVHKTY